MLSLSKWLEARIGLRAGRVTLPYPSQGRPTPEHFRGRPIFDPTKCTGCGGCANNCPAREILISDLCQEIRVVSYLGQRCTYCGRCAEVCPEKAITMSHEFESATNAISDFHQRLEIFMSTCQRCGRCFKDPDALEQLKLTGYRADDLEHGRSVLVSSSYLERERTVDDIPIELD
jgi:hydrogenase-4 component H